MNHFMHGDRVKYTGEKHRQELKDDYGFIVTPVQNQDNTYVVSFSEDDHIVHASLLVPHHFTPGKSEGPEVTKQRRRTKAKAPEEQE